jgi:methyl coenzyme M reductase subunit C
VIRGIQVPQVQLALKAHKVQQELQDQQDHKAQRVIRGIQVPQVQLALKAHKVQQELQDQQDHKAHKETQQLMTKTYTQQPAQERFMLA